MKALLTTLTLTLALATPLYAGDGVASSGHLSDKDFFRLATCGAAPGDACQTPKLRWTKRQISVGLAKAAPDYPPKLALRVGQELDRAIAEINRAGSAIKLRRDDRLRQPDILVSLPSLNEGDLTKDIPRMPDGEAIGVGFMWLWWNDAKAVTEASILISQDITAADLPSVMLEELFQSLGFLYDIENPAYEGVSILAQDSNSTTTLTGQDLMLLQQLYPVK